MEPFIGMIGMFGFTFAPRLWSFCAGATIAVSQQTTLFSLLGTTYGGDGRTSFMLPDLRGRAPIGFGRHPGSLYDWRLGQAAGAESHTMTVSQMATHDHTASFAGTGGGGGGAITTTTKLIAKLKGGSSNAPAAGDFISGGGSNLFGAGGGFGNADVELGGLQVTVSGGGGGITGGDVTVNANGGQQAFGLTQPVLAVNYCIALDGIYPSRS